MVLPNNFFLHGDLKSTAPFTFSHQGVAIGQSLCITLGQCIETLRAVFPEDFKVYGINLNDAGLTAVTAIIKNQHLSLKAKVAGHAGLQEHF